jgi:hypothetical protein
MCHFGTSAILTKKTRFFDFWPWYFAKYYLQVCI